MASDDIQGTVVDSSGTAVEGAVVEVAPASTDGTPDSDKAVVTTTDNNGNYLIENHPEGDGTSQEWHISAYNWDGSSWINVYTQPGVTAELTAPIPDSDTLGFEDMTDWSVVNGSQVSDRVHNGSYSYYSTSNYTNEQAVLDFNSINPSEIVYYYQETSNSTGQGVRFYNSNNHDELGTGTDNPQFVVDSSSGINTTVGSSGDGVYNVWVKVTHNFNWSGDTVTVSFDRLDGSNSGQTTVDLKQGIDISRIELWNFSQGNGWGDHNIDGWWDSFSITV